MGIKHIEDLKPQDLLTFLMDWNKDSTKFFVTEKIDGNFFTFGIQNNEFFIRTKANTYFNPEQIPNLFFMEEFKRYFIYLKNVPLLQIVKNLSLKHNIDFNGSIEIIGEAVPTHDHNIVIYDKQKIGDGVFVLFEVKISDNTILNADLWKELSKEINMHSIIKVHVVPTFNLSDFKFKRIIESELRKIVGMKDVLNTPARTPESKRRKENLLNESRKLGVLAKEQILKHQFKSLFGNEFEGLVITSSNGTTIKIVDKNKFTKRKDENWVYVNLLITLQNNFKKNIKQLPFDLGIWLKEWRSSLSKIENQFLDDKLNGTISITIPKKITETEKSIKLDYDRISIMENLLYNEKKSPLEIRDMFLSKQIVPTNS